MKDNTIVIASAGSVALSTTISHILGISVLTCAVRHFNNGETRIDININLRNRHVIIVAQMRSRGQTINDDLVSTIMLLDACQRSDVAYITLVMPYYPYSRSDKKDKPRVPIGASVVATMLKPYPIRNLISLDLHAGQIQGMIDRGFHNLYFINYLSASIDKKDASKNIVLVSPDAGGIKRVEAYSQKMNLPYVTLHKTRDFDQPGVVMTSQLIGNSQYVGKIGIIIDDMADTMGTMISAVNVLISAGIKSVIILVTHGLFSSDVAIARINNCTSITDVVCSDSLPQEHNQEKCSKLRVISCAKIITDVINAIENGNSVSEIFE